MKVREYLNLVKFLDSKNRNELNNFVLKPDFNISHNLQPLALSGGWNLNTSNIEFPEQYSYLLDFYVIKDRYDSLLSYCDNAIHEHDKAVDKRNDGKWFIWQ